MALATSGGGFLGCVIAGGEHYFIDVLAAIPFTIAVQKVADSHALRNWRLSPASKSARVTS